jgi:hypothetical protein
LLFFFGELLMPAYTDIYLDTDVIANSILERPLPDPLMDQPSTIKAPPQRTKPVPAQLRSTCRPPDLQPERDQAPLAGRGKGGLYKDRRLAEQTVQADLDDLRKAWQQYQEAKGKNAVYIVSTRPGPRILPLTAAIWMSWGREWLG